MTRAADFTPYDASHLVAVLVLLVGAGVLVVLGRRGRGTDPHDRLGKALAVVVVATTLPLQVLYFTPDYFNPAKTLPIQLCDLASVVSAYALWTHRWWATGLTFYWGLFLTTQAILTPDLDSGFPDPVFLLFWGMHVFTVWAAVYLTWGRGLGPGWRAYRVAVVATATWAVTVFCLNLALGTNYGFLNRKPSATTVIDLLGPWPWYVLAEIAIVCTVWALATWPFARSVRSGASAAAATSTASAGGSAPPASRRRRP